MIVMNGKPDFPLFLIFVLFLIPTLSAQNIQKLEFSGLVKTDERYVRHFINTTEQMPFDSLSIRQDLQRLRNLQLFLDVGYSVRDSLNGKVVNFIFRELITLLPIVNFGGVTDNFWYQLGLVDYNWLGRGNILGGYYRYFDRHSFEIYLQMPYLYRTDWGINANISKFSTIEPAYFTEGAAEYNVDHWAFILAGRYNVSIRTAIEFGGGYLYERYEKHGEQTGPGPALADFDKSLYKVVIRHNNIDHFFYYLDGFSSEMNIESVLTAGEADPFWKILNISNLFLRSGHRGNLAIRARTGVSTNKVSPFVPFVLDNYVNVRGSGNRVSRGTAEFTINAEYRYTLFDQKWTALQALVFTDMSAWRPAGGTFSEMFKSRNNVTFSGLGLRLHLPLFNNFIFRLDYGVSWTNENERGIVFGTGQYF